MLDISKFWHISLKYSHTQLYPASPRSTWLPDMYEKLGLRTPFHHVCRDKYINDCLKFDLELSFFL